MTAHIGPKRHPHPRIEYGAGSSPLPRRERGFSHADSFNESLSRDNKKQAQHWLSGLAVKGFRFLATLGMTGRRGRIIATNPFYLPLSAHDGRGD